jgi:gas vesicle protein
MSSAASYIKGFTTGAFIGGLAGAGLAFFLSPRTGAQNRRLVHRRFDILKDRAQDIGEDISDTVMEIFGEVSEATVGLYEDGRHLFEKQLRTFKNNWEDIDKEKYHDIVNSIGESLESNKKHRIEDIEDLKRYWRKNWRKIEGQAEKTSSSIKNLKAVKAITGK